MQFYSRFTILFVPCKKWLVWQPDGLHKTSALMTRHKNPGASYLRFNPEKSKSLTPYILPHFGHLIFFLAWRSYFRDGIADLDTFAAFLTLKFISGHPALLSFFDDHS